MSIASAVQLAILYGSVARDTHRQESDVDLAIAGDSRAALREDVLLNISLECSRAIARDVQIRDLARAQGLFLKQVFTTG